VGGLQRDVQGGARELLTQVGRSVCVFRSVSRELGLEKRPKPERRRESPLRQTKKNREKFDQGNNRPLETSYKLRGSQEEGDHLGNAGGVDSLGNSEGGGALTEGRVGG